eukprot:1031427-Pelagomonas_calceolata.AAC.1
MKADCKMCGWMQACEVLQGSLECWVIKAHCKMCGWMRACEELQGPFKLMNSGACVWSCVGTQDQTTCVWSCAGHQKRAGRRN